MFVLQLLKWQRENYTHQPTTNTIELFYSNSKYLYIWIISGLFQSDAKQEQDIQQVTAY